MTDLLREDHRYAMKEGWHFAAKRTPRPSEDFREIACKTACSKYQREGRRTAFANAADMAYTCQN